MEDTPYCTSCGSPIPPGQGRSCSMCYGDPYYGRDGYMLDFIAEQDRREQEYRENERQQQEEE